MRARAARGVPLILSLLALSAPAHALPAVLNARGAAMAMPDPAALAGESVSEPVGWTEPRQGHAGPEVYSIDVEITPHVAAYLDTLRSGNMAWLRGAMERAFIYRSAVMGVIERYSLPPELALLPVVESEYRPWAISRSGAAGLWQFMPNSIDGYDMRIDDMVDERRDFWKATDAALRKLKSNYDHFGDWLIALAAYNCGRGAMDRIIASTGIRDFWELLEGGHLPPETARYIPKFIGIVKTASYPGRNGLETYWDPPVVWERVAMSKSVNIELLAAVTGTPAILLERGNAELHYPVTPEGASRYYLKVPRESRAKIEAALADPQIALMRYQVHTIRTGDTLYALGLRFGVSVDLIQRHNVGVDPQRLRIGSKLFIPLLGDPVAEEPLQADAGVPAPILDSSYVVAQGDTLWSVSRRHGISVEELASGNGIGLGAIIRPGDVLKVPTVSAIMGNDE